MFLNGWPPIYRILYIRISGRARDIQVAACEVIFDSDDNLLLSSGTASGKSEAAFLPILTDLQQAIPLRRRPLSALKALINDQFKRLDLLHGVDLPVCSGMGMLRLPKNSW